MIWQFYFLLQDRGMVVKSNRCWYAYANLITENNKRKRKNRPIQTEIESSKRTRLLNTYNSGAFKSRVIRPYRLFSRQTPFALDYHQA